jgi:uncharacterized protein involved in exopolysaccharide biosynthesis
VLETFRAQLVASDISQAMELTDLALRVEILSPPQVPLAPARPDQKGILLSALLMGPLLGMVIAITTELMDSTLRSLSDFQRVFDGKVLGTPPLVSRPETRPRGRRRRWAPAALLSIILLTLLVVLLVRPTLLRSAGSTGDENEVTMTGVATP